MLPSPEEKAATLLMVLGRKEMDQSGGPPSRDGESKNSPQELPREARAEIGVGKPDTGSIALGGGIDRAKAVLGSKQGICGVFFAKCAASGGGFSRNRLGFWRNRLAEERVRVSFAIGVSAVFIGGYGKLLQWISVKVGARKSRGFWWIP